jgi:AcrR family transcriptional regulator
VASSNTPLTRARVLSAAVSFADKNGIESLSMRKLGQQLGVEAMSLYNHVANKDDVLDGIVEMVVGEFAIPPDQAHWRVALHQTAKSTREVLIRHPWAPALIESRVTPSRVRFRYADAVIGTLRRAGFSNELAYKAQLAIDSYILGFTLQEVSWPFQPEEQRDLAATLGLQVAPDEYPYLAEMMNWISQTRVTHAAKKDNVAYESEFEFGLDLILDGLERLRHE